MPVIIAAGNHGADLDDVARCRVDKPIGAHGLAIDGGRQECEGHLALGDPARERDVDLRAVIEGAQRPPGRIVAVDRYLRPGAAKQTCTQRPQSRICAASWAAPQAGDRAFRNEGRLPAELKLGIGPRYLTDSFLASLASSP